VNRRFRWLPDEDDLLADEVAADKVPADDALLVGVGRTATGSAPGTALGGPGGGFVVGADNDDDDWEDDTTD
jgi:hypothetical protein